MDQIFKLGIKYLVFVSVFQLLSLGKADDLWNEDRDPNGTLSELGGINNSKVQYSEYASRYGFQMDVAYGIPMHDYYKMGMQPIYDLCGKIIDEFTWRNVSYLYPGYMQSFNSSDLTWGFKVEENDWLEFLSYNKNLSWLLILVLLIVIMPFIGVCYCCFCCCRCPKQCPPCQKDVNSRCKLCVCSLLLLLLTLGLLFAFYVMIIAQNRIYRGTKDRVENIRRGTEGYCAFVRNAKNHIHHLFIVNFKELEGHIVKELEDAHKHVAINLADVLSNNAIVKLDRILKNINEAYPHMVELEKAEKQARFYNEILREGLRGVKRDSFFAFGSLCNVKLCTDHIKSTQIAKIDSSKCFHFDLIPNATPFLSPMRNTIDKELKKITSKLYERLAFISKEVRGLIAPIIAPLTARLQKIESQLRDEKLTINKIIESTIHDMFERNVLSINFFGDIDNRFGHHRQLISAIACILLLVLLIALIIGLIGGLCYRSRNIGSNCMILVIVLIFCIYSFITLLGLFYFLLGFIAHQSACGRLGLIGVHALEDLLSESCREDQYFFDLLSVKEKYDLEDIEFNKVWNQNYDDVPTHSFSQELANFSLLTPTEITEIKSTLLNLYPLNSKVYRDNLCTIPDNFMSNLYENHTNLVKDLIHVEDCFEHKPLNYSCIVGSVISNDISALKKHIDPPLRKYIRTLQSKIKKIGDLILTKDQTFGKTMDDIFLGIRDAEIFVRHRGSEFINEVGKNLTSSIEINIRTYIKRIIDKSRQEVGWCGPISHVVESTLQSRCNKFIAPINAFWLGLLLCSLLLLPLLFVAHCLICVYRSKSTPKSQMVYLVQPDGCPTCSGVPYVPPPLVIFSGVHRDLPPNQRTFNTEDNLQSTNKRKWD